MQEISADWQGLTEEQRSAYDRDRDELPRRTVPAAPVARSANSVGRSTFPFSGDDCYPLRTDLLGDLPKRIGKQSSQWADVIGCCPVRPRCKLDAPVRHLCEDVYGRGVCSSTISPDAQRAHDSALVRLRNWCSIRRCKPCKLTDMWDRLGIFYVGPRVAPAAGADALPPGYVGLLIYTELSPLECVVCLKRALPPSIGDRIDFELSMATLADHIETIRTSLLLHFQDYQPCCCFWLLPLSLFITLPLSLFVSMVLLLLLLLLLLLPLSLIITHSLSLLVRKGYRCRCHFLCNHYSATFEPIPSHPAPSPFQFGWYPRTINRTIVAVPADHVFFDVACVHVGLLSFRVSGLRTLTDLVGERDTKKKQKLEMDKLRRLAAGEEAGSRKPTVRARGARGKKRCGKGRKAEHDDAGRDSEEDDEGSASGAEGDADTSSDFSEGAVSEHSDAAAPGDDGGGDGGVDGPPVPVPYIDDDGRMWRGDEFLGRISVIRPGARDESLSVYCSRHQCKVAKRISNGIPSREAILDWVVAGLATPRETGAMAQWGHKKDFPVARR